MPPKVSICIPAYNQTELLHKTLESIKKQSYTNYEVIVTDDSKDDAVKNLCSQFNLVGKLTYYKNPVALGSPANWNEAIGKASGEYIKIMHHDDWFADENSLQAFIKMLDDRPEADLAFSASSIFNLQTNQFKLNQATQKQLEELKHEPEILFFGNFIGAPSATIYRRKASLTFDTQVKYVVDIDFYIRLLQQNNKFVYNEKPLIVNTSDSKEQVTFESINKKTQLVEYAYLYNKLGITFPSLKHLRFFANQFVHYNIKSLNEYKSLNASPPRPKIAFNLLLLYIKLFKE